ncbi:hypothetical protein BCY91_12290 [Pelobium manganitolerans]|uniref:Glycosyltransferase 2-like domain-containing protein n=2 Tax=Pelobium manganitolerans TaxID=1842495 RepID=A0A419S1R1_9SPHI|nr:hypothetical protein BCY91_12290 [Pelobium manganitolerans]
MEMKPAISVILPVYNGGYLLVASVQSVLQQDIGNFEFLICDDCSTDESLNLLRKVCDGVPQVKILQNDSNQGLFKTLNRLMHESSAPLIHLWSQDDIMKSHCLRSTIAFHDEHPSAGMSYSLRDLIDENDILISSAPQDGTPEIINKSLYAKISAYWGCMPGNIANVAITRFAFEKIGEFNTAMKVSGDFEYWTRIAQHYDIGFNKDPNIFLRVHKGQLSQQSNSVAHRIMEDITIMQTLLSMASEKDLPRLNLSWRWKTQTSYFNELIYLMRKREWALARKSYRAIRNISSPLPLSLRWFVVKMMRLAGCEFWFYKKVIKTLI